ncbi:MAG TPA: hypothetical protein VFT22_37715, partial [Kofleriaceae bacterium]|nr:hypothetical protein [Kofleriaceae bacterium]
MDPGGGHARATRAAELAACTLAEADGPWTSQGFSAQTGRFIAELTATPSESPTDAVVGLSAGPASWFPDLAAIVRFNPDGVIDVRAGDGYQADVVFPYTAGTPYHFRLDIDVGSHLYSVAVQSSLGGFTSLANGYPFRTEQAQVAQLDNLSTQVDSSSGAIEVCDLRITGIDASGCPVAVAGGGFIEQSIGQPGEVLVFSDFVATPDQILDGVIGLSPRPATSFDDLAATVRFSPDGVIDARSGDTYQADVALPYAAGEPRRVRIIANVATHTFSAYVATGGFDSVQLARRYEFRTAQSAASFLGDLDAIVDSPQGTMSICDARHTISIGVRMAREGNYAVAPLPTGDEALISDATTTLRVTGNGRTLAQLAAGGQVAVDPAGNVYLARITGTDLVVEAYTAGLAPRW